MGTASLIFGAASLLVGLCTCGLYIWKKQISMSAFWENMKKVKMQLDLSLTFVLSYTLHYCGDVGLFVLPK